MLDFWHEVSIVSPNVAPIGSSVSFSDVLLVLGMGVRFDALVVGFILFLPILLGVLPKVSRLPIGPWVGQVLFLCSGGLILFVVCQSVIDFLFWVTWKTRVNVSFLDNPEVRNQVWISFQNLSFLEKSKGVLVIVLIIVFALKLLKRAIGQGLDLAPGVTKESARTIDLQFGLSFLVSLLLAGLMARGTLAPKHLAMEHAEVTANRTFNSLCLNPSFTFFKDPF